jgi:hypothetical protein
MTQKRATTRPAPGIGYSVLQSKLQALFHSVGARGHVDSVSSASQAFAFTLQNQQALVETLAEGYTQAKAQSYAHAVQTTAYLEKPPIAPYIPGKQGAQKWANGQATGIVSTYHDALDQHLAKEKKRSPFMILGAVLIWLNGFVKWKAPQIAKTTWYAGVSAGTQDWIGDHMGWLSDQDTPLVAVQVVPETAVCDECKQYAGQTYDIGELDSLPDFPLHPNCQHSIEIITL